MEIERRIGDKCVFSAVINGHKIRLTSSNGSANALRFFEAMRKTGTQFKSSPHEYTVTPVRSVVSNGPSTADVINVTIFDYIEAQGIKLTDSMQDSINKVSLFAARKIGTRALNPAAVRRVALGVANVLLDNFETAS